jgi:hypothetical protein
MSGLEEQTIEHLGDRCEECGARLTEPEMRAALESGGPVLCSVHAAENVTADPDEAEAGSPEG